LIRAILWAQWRSIRILRFSSTRRGALFSIVTSLLWYGFWMVTAVGLASFIADPKLQRDVELLFPAILVFVILYWQLAPILVASLGASPVPRAAFEREVNALVSRAPAPVWAYDFRMWATLEPGLPAASSTAAQPADLLP